MSVDLTEEGFKHRDEVVDVIFSYIHKLNAPTDAAVSTAKNTDKNTIQNNINGIPSYVYNEVSTLSAIGFNYSEKSDPASTVSLLVADMQEYLEPKDYITGPRLYEHQVGGG